MSTMEDFQAQLDCAKDMIASLECRLQGMEEMNGMMSQPKVMISNAHVTGTESLEDLSRVINRKLTNNPTQLISRILSHFLEQDTMNKGEYEELRQHYKTKFSSGNHGAVYSLQKHPNSWMAKQQNVYGNIIVEEGGDCIRITTTWKRALNIV